MNYYEPIVYCAAAEDEGKTLRHILKTRLGMSKRLISRVKRTERGILVNGERRFTDYAVRAGDRIEIRMEEEVSDDILPQPMPLDILYEDDHFLIVNKPAPQIVHPTLGHYINTLANGVMHYWLSQNKKHRFRPIHRLDEHTSGVLAIAKNAYAHEAVTRQWLNDKVGRHYIAFVHGHVAGKAEISAPIARDPAEPHIRIVTPTGAEAVTLVEPLVHYRQATMVRLRLKTGRTHQIRVHMKHIGHPLIGDPIYGDADRDRELPHRIRRQALHAQQLSFVHPIAREMMVWRAPLAEDLRQLRQALERPDAGL